MNQNTKKSKLLAAVQAIRLDFETSVLREIYARPKWPYRRVAELVGVSEQQSRKSRKAIT